MLSGIVLIRKLFTLVFVYLVYNFKYCSFVCFVCAIVSFVMLLLFASVWLSKSRIEEIPQSQRVPLFLVEKKWQ